jgi:putative ABC transport system permease protein
MGMPPNDLKLFTAVLVAIALSLPLVQNKFKILRKKRNGNA